MQPTIGMASLVSLCAAKEVKPRIREIFLEFVRPSDVLNAFQKYDIGVLTKRDIENVAAKTRECGDTDGAVLLLDRLKRYKNWFPCLLQVLEDPDIEQHHVAEMMRSADKECPYEWQMVYDCYNAEMKNAIQQLFVHFVLPLHVLHGFQNLYPYFLDDREINAIQNVTERKGNHDGAIELLDVIHRKRDWFPYLMAVLRDHNVKMDHVADDMENKTESMRREFEGQMNNKHYETNDGCYGNNVCQAANNRSAITLMLTGKTGCGKSRIGDTLLGNRLVLESFSSSHPCYNFWLSGRFAFMEVDTPSMISTKKEGQAGMDAAINTMIVVSECPNEIDALILEIRDCGRFTCETASIVRCYKHMLDDNLWKHTLVVVTFIDKFTDSEDIDITFDTWYKQQAEGLHQLYNDCDGRFVLFNNTEIYGEINLGEQIWLLRLFVEFKYIRGNILLNVSRKQNLTAKSLH